MQKAFLTDVSSGRTLNRCCRATKVEAGRGPTIAACPEGILWVLKTGARWRDLPKAYPSPSTCWRRLRQWEEQGLWLKIWRTFLAELDQRGTLDWSESFLDASFAPAKKGASASAQPNAARARSGWWWSTAKVGLCEVT